MKITTKKTVAWSMALTLSLNLAACGSAGTASDASSSAESGKTDSSVSASIADASASTSSVTDSADSAAESTSEAEEVSAPVTYPVTVTDALGREVTVAQKPEKLVSGYYITTSLLISLGLSDKLVGVEAKADTRSIYALSAPGILELPSVGTAKEFDLEGCAALSPDLVIVPAKLKDSIPAMEELGLTVVAVNPEDQDLLFDTIDLIGTATDTVSQGETLKQYITDSLTELDTALVDADTPSVYLAGNSSLLQTAGLQMYQNSMIENAYGSNAAYDISDTYWAEVSYEQLLSWNPDCIVLASDAEYTTDSVLQDASLADCTAVKENQIYQIPGDIEALDSPIPGSFLGSIYLASVLHPDLVTADDFADATKEFYETFYGFTPEEYEK